MFNIGRVLYKISFDATSSFLYTKVSILVINSLAMTESIIER